MSVLIFFYKFIAIDLIKLKIFSSDLLFKEEINDEFAKISRSTFLIFFYRNIYPLF